MAKSVVFVLRVSDSWKVFNPDVDQLMSCNKLCESLRVPGEESPLMKRVVHQIYFRSLHVAERRELLSVQSISDCNCQALKSDLLCESCNDDSSSRKASN